MAKFIASKEKSIPKTCFAPAFATEFANRPVPQPTSKTFLFFQLNSFKISSTSQVLVPCAMNDVKCFFHLFCKHDHKKFLISYFLP